MLVPRIVGKGGIPSAVTGPRVLWLFVVQHSLIRSEEAALNVNRMLRNVDAGASSSVPYLVQAYFIACRCTGGILFVNSANFLWPVQLRVLEPLGSTLWKDFVHQIQLRR